MITLASLPFWLERGGGITPSSRERHKGIIGRGDNRDLGFVDAIFEGEIRNGKFFLVDTQCSIFFSFVSIESYLQARSRGRGSGGLEPPQKFSDLNLILLQKWKFSTKMDSFNTLRQRAKKLVQNTNVHINKIYNNYSYIILFNLKKNSININI